MVIGQGTSGTRDGTMAGGPSHPWIAPLVLVLLVGAAAVLANFMTDTAGAVTRGVGGTVVVAAILYGAKRNRASPRGAWVLLAIGIGAWVAGDAVWDGFAIAGLSAGWYTVPNALYLLTYPVLFLAIIGIVGAHGRKRSLDHAIDCAILSFAAALILRVTLVDAHFTGTTLDTIFSAAFPFGDALLLGAIGWLLFESGTRNPAAWLLASGVTAMLATDVAWDLQVRLFGTAASDTWVNPFYPIAYALVGAAALHPAVARLGSRAVPALRYRNPARLAFLGISLAAMAVIAWRGSRDDLLVQLCTVALVGVIVIRFATLVRDLENAYRAVDTNERRFRLLATAAPVGIYETNADFEVVFANEESTRLAGRSVVGMTPDRMIAAAVEDEDRPSIREAVKAVTAGSRAQAEFRMRAADGSQRWVAWYGTPMHQAPEPFTGAFASTMDITALKNAQAELSRQASHDPLTDLPNRRLLLDRLSGALARLTRRPGMVAVLFLDLDGFKKVNDQLGHDSGDELLKVVARRLQDTVRQDDTVGRFGGDEFVVILESVLDRDHAALVAAKIIRAIRVPIDLKDGPAQVAASIGIAISPDPRDDPSALLRDADVAMYRAKSAGRSGWQFIDDITGDDITGDDITRDDITRDDIAGDDLAGVHPDEA